MIERAYVEIGNICNLACSFCHGTKRAPRQMSPEELRLVLDRLSGRVKNIYLHLMGEPFFHPRLLELIDICAEYGFPVSITTNGTLLEGMAEPIANRASVVHKLSFSLHAPEANGNFSGYREYIERICSFAKRIADAGTYAVMRLWNLDSEEKQGKNSNNGEIMELLRESFPEPWQERRTGYRLSKNIFLEYAEIFTWPEDSCDKPRDRGFCHGISGQIGILADGTVVPCCLDAEGSAALGNIFEDSLESILCSPKASAMAKGFSRGELVEPLCKTCSYAKRFDNKS